MRTAIGAVSLADGGAQGTPNRAVISLNEAAGLLDCSRSTIQNYRSGKTAISTPVATTVRAMMRDETPLYAQFRPVARGRPRKRA